MPVRDIIPWRRHDDPLAHKDSFSSVFSELQGEMNRLFKGFMTDAMDFDYRTSFMPSVDVLEDSGAIEVKAELPGMDEKDIEVSFEDHDLILKGEKKQEKEEKKHGVHRFERSFGSFYRRIPIPKEVDSDKVEASFRKGVLHVKLPKLETREPAKKLKVKVN